MSNKFQIGTQVYALHCKPFKFEINGKWFVGGMMPWIDYSDNALEVANKAYEEWMKEREATKATPVTVQEKTFPVASHSDPNKKYTVTQHTDGSWSCDCVGYGYRRKCSHIEKAKGKKDA